MKTDDWNPGHSPTNAYPFNEIVSAVTFQKRPHFFQEKEGEHAGKIRVIYDEAVYGSITEEEDLKDFLFMRAFDYQEALKIAEGQINDILTEHPFFPEKMGFELVIKPENTTEPPVRMYVNKHDTSFSLFRTPGAGEAGLEISSWTLLKKNADQTFSRTVLNLPSARIAFVALFAHGVKVNSDEEKVFDIGDNIPEEKPEVTLQRQAFTGVKTSHVIEFKRGDNELIVPVNADDDKDAMSKAKFILETDNDSPVENVLFEEMKVVTL